MQVLAATLIVLSLTLSACGSDDPETGSADEPTEAESPTAADTEPATPEADEPDEPDEKSLRAAADEVGARVGSQDYTGYWDMWSADDKDAVGKEKYAAYAEKCDLGGVALEVEAVRLESDGTGVVRYGVLGQSRSVPFLVEDGAWVVDISDETIDGAKSGTC